MSAGLGVIPSAWQTAVITHVPKCRSVSEVNDLIPIPVTPILSRMVERLIFRDHIFPATPSNESVGQYGFKPTDSTTAAIVDITDRLAAMLEDNNFVSFILIDFSKAFDSIDHLTLVAKPEDPNIADNII